MHTMRQLITARTRKLQLAFAFAGALATVVPSEAQTTQGTLQEQAVCAAQAKKYYPQTYIGESYQSHYNAKLQRCFVLATTKVILPRQADPEKSNLGTITVKLFDAFEKRTFANFSTACHMRDDFYADFYNDNGNWLKCEDHSDAKTTCNYIDKSGLEQRCARYQEFASVVAQYMN